MCKFLPTTLHRSARAWYHSLKHDFILHFHYLRSKLISRFSISIPTKTKVPQNSSQSHNEKIKVLGPISNILIKKKLNMERLFEPIATEPLINGVYNYSFLVKLYTILDKDLLEVKHAIKNHIRVEEAGVTKQCHLYFYASSPRHQFSTRASKRNIKRHIHDRLTFFELITTHLTTTQTKALVII